jgi:hypothetical protein
MYALLRARHSHGACVGQAADEIVRNERRVAGHGDDRCGVGTIHGGPGEPRLNARKRPLEVGQTIADNRPPERGEVGEIAIGADEHVGDLWFEPGDDVGQHWPATELSQGLVAATHAARPAAR